MKKLKLMRWMSLPLLCGGLLLSGCGGETLPAAELARSESAVTQAKEEEAYTYAPVEIKLAEEALTKAKVYIEEEEYEKARDLLIKAEQDARLAISKARSEKAKRQAEEMEDSIETLKRETERK